MLKKKLSTLVILTSLAPCMGYAQTATTRMAECLVSSTTGAERVALARWIGFAIIAHPSVSENVAVPKVVIDQSDQEIAELLTQLMTDRCRAQTIASLAESDASFENAFEVLGAVAMEELMRDKAVEARITAFAALIDESRFSGMD